MEKLTIYKNKGTTFKCNLEIEGAEDVDVRLCLEFNNNIPSMFFHGKLNEDGDCSINIPKLDAADGNGYLYIEAIADSMYFKLHESQFEVKKSVNVKMLKTETVEQEPIKQTKIKLNRFEEDINKLKEVRREEPVHKSNLQSFVERLRNK